MWVARMFCWPFLELGAGLASSEMTWKCRRGFSKGNREAAQGRQRCEGWMGKNNS